MSISPNRWHEIVSSGTSALRYPRVTVVGRRNEGITTNHSLLRSLRKESDRKKFGKLGVTRMGPPPPGFPDSEFASLNSLMQKLQEVVEFPGPLAPSADLYFEQMSDRLFRDCDLVSVTDIVFVLDSLRQANYFNLKLIIKLGNELVYDVAKIGSTKSIGILLNAYSHFNVVIPKLNRALLQRALQICSNSNSPNKLESVGHFPLIVRAVKHFPHYNRPIEFKLLVDEIVGNGSLMVTPNRVPEVAHMLHDLTSMKKSPLTKSQANTLVNCTLSVLTANVTPGAPRDTPLDIESLSMLLHACAYCELTNVPPTLVNDILAHGGSVTASVHARPALGEKTIDYMRLRDRGVMVASRIVLSANSLGLDSLVSAYAPALTRESVKGLPVYMLMDLADREVPIVREVVLEELVRKGSILSKRQKQQLASVTKS